jgi:hypothetical protein
MANRKQRRRRRAEKRAEDPTDDEEWAASSEASNEVRKRNNTEKRLKNAVLTFFETLSPDAKVHHIKSNAEGMDDVVAFASKLQHVDLGFQNKIESQHFATLLESTSLLSLAVRGRGAAIHLANCKTTENKLVTSLGLWLFEENEMGGELLCLSSSVDEAVDRFLHTRGGKGKCGRVNRQVLTINLPHKADHSERKDQDELAQKGNGDSVDVGLIVNKFPNLKHLAVYTNYSTNLGTSATKALLLESLEYACISEGKGVYGTRRKQFDSPETVTEGNGVYDNRWKQFDSPETVTDLRLLGLACPTEKGDLNEIFARENLRDVTLSWGKTTWDPNEEVSGVVWPRLNVFRDLDASMHSGSSISIAGFKPMAVEFGMDGEAQRSLKKLLDLLLVPKEGDETQVLNSVFEKLNGFFRVSDHVNEVMSSVVEGKGEAIQVHGSSGSSGGSVRRKDPPPPSPVSSRTKSNPKSAGGGGSGKADARVGLPGGLLAALAQPQKLKGVDAKDKNILGNKIQATSKYNGKLPLKRPDAGLQAHMARLREAVGSDVDESEFDEQPESEQTSEQIERDRRDRLKEAEDAEKAREAAEKESLAQLARNKSIRSKAKPQIDLTA